MHATPHSTAACTGRLRVHAHSMHCSYCTSVRCHIVHTSLPLSTTPPYVCTYLLLPFPSLSLSPSPPPPLPPPLSCLTPHLSTNQSEVEPSQTFTVKITPCPVGYVLTGVNNGESGPVYQTCKCVVGGDSPILKCDLDEDSLVLKVGNRVGRAGWSRVGWTG